MAYTEINIKNLRIQATFSIHLELKIKDKSQAIGVSFHRLKPLKFFNPMIYMNFSKGQEVNLSFIKGLFVH